MGTRADFYIKEKNKLEWVGSIGWDGYPDGIDFGVLYAKTKEEFKKELKQFFSKREDVTLPENGWPWPWETSSTTDYAYVFDGKGVVASCFGRNYFNALEWCGIENKIKALNTAVRVFNADKKEKIKGVDNKAVIESLNMAIGQLEVRRDELVSDKKPNFPDMSKIKNVAMDSRSGLIVVKGK